MRRPFRGPRLPRNDRSSLSIYQELRPPRRPTYLSYTQRHAIRLWTGANFRARCAQDCAPFFTRTMPHRLRLRLTSNFRGRHFVDRGRIPSLSM